MSPKTIRKKHIPQRTCIGCREVLSKRSLIRVVRSSSGIIIDSTGKIAGRGAYLHNQRTCWEKGLKNALSSALKTEITFEEQDRLKAYMLSLPEED